MLLQKLVKDNKRSNNSTFRYIKKYPLFLRTNSNSPNFKVDAKFGNDVRLQTHTWHAKRFLMKKDNGYRIAAAHQHRSFKSSERAANFGCIIQDISFLRPISIKCQDENVVLQFMYANFMVCLWDINNSLRFHT